MTNKQAFRLGHKQAAGAVEESGSTEPPDGGWDSWLIDGIGTNATWILFGEPEGACDADEWTDTMAEKLTAYHAGAVKACEEIDKIQRQQPFSR